VRSCTNAGLSFAVFYLFYEHWPLSGALFAALGRAGDSLAMLMRDRGLGSVDAALANVFGHSAGVVNSFFWNKHWTFGAQNRTASRFGRFVLSAVASLLLSSATLLLFIDLLGWWYLPVWIVTVCAVTLVNFLMTKYWVFR
jgi:putative flippase GtrA